MTKSLIYSISFHALMICLTILSLPFMTRQPIDLPPILSVDLIQITDKTNIPFAPKAREILKKIKKEEEKRVVSEQAPPTEKKMNLSFFKKFLQRCLTVTSATLVLPPNRSYLKFIQNPRRFF